MLYTAFGLIIASEYEIPELITVQKREPDVEIRVGTVPQLTDKVIGRSPIYESSVRQVRYDIENVARFLVDDGKQIIIEPYPEAASSSVRAFLLGTVFGAILHQRGILPLHASAIVTDKGAVLFCGTSGAGKSTLAASFRQRGYLMLADDIVATIKTADNQLMTIPGFPHQRLWSDSLEYLQDANEYPQVRPNLDKFVVPIHDAFVQTPTPLRAIFTLERANVEHAVAEPLTGLAKINKLHFYTYSRMLQKQLGISQAQVGVYFMIAAQIPMWQVKRSSYALHVDGTADLIEEILSR